MNTLTRAVFAGLCFLGAALSQTQKATPTPTPAEIDTTTGSRLPHAQHATPTPTPETTPAVDCSKVHEYLFGCKSFNEMLAAKDKDVLSALTGLYQGYVCFRVGEDVFTIVSFEKPSPSGFRKVGLDVLERTGVAKLTRYKDGLSEDLQIYRGKWSMAAYESIDAASFSGNELYGPPGQQRSPMYINNAEISVSYKWKNVSNTMTSYTLQIRRSTKRGLETLEAPPLPTDKVKSTYHETFQNYCEYYPNQ